MLNQATIQMRQDVDAFIDKLEKLTEADITLLAKQTPAHSALDTELDIAMEHAAMASGAGAQTATEAEEADNWQYAMAANERITKVMQRLERYNAESVVFCALVATQLRSTIGELFTQSDYNTLSSSFKSALGKINPADPE